jgi:hypothetical protein
MQGHWDNKGWDKSDPGKLAIEASKAALELQKHFGVPAEQLIKLPKDLGDAEGMKPVFARLGVPADAKEYDLNGIKLGGKDLEASFADKMRAALLNAAVTKDKAPTVVKAVVEHMQAEAEAKAAEATTRKGQQVAKLKENWGDKNIINESYALQGANRLGLTQEQYNKACDAVGYDVFPELMRKIGVGTSEDTFHENNSGTAPTTVNGAKARLALLQAQPEWGRKLISKTDGAAEKAEFANLMQIINGAA